MFRAIHFITMSVAVSVLLTSTACTSIEAQIQKLDLQKQSSQQRLAAIGNKRLLLQNQSNKLANELRANHNQTLAFVRDHPGVIACIASGSIVVDEGNVFSDDIKELGAAVGLICVFIYLASEDFQKSVDDFLTEINAASDREKNLQSQLNALRPKIESETQAMNAEKAKLDALTEEIEKLRAKQRS